MKPKILYVEDNPYSVYLMEFYIRRKQNIELLIATNGQDGWEQAISEQPDQIMLDINLPDMDGWDLAKKLRSNPKTQSIPLVAVTSLTTAENYRSSERAGIDLHISKSTDHRTLFQHVNEIISRRVA